MMKIVFRCALLITFQHTNEGIPMGYTHLPLKLYRIYATIYWTFYLQCQLACIIN